ncbi:Z1 domain-containing protein [Ruminococcaceae bacterium KH2T8]|nr:Z1 domain-containing protein [Ruminococcaceae bacterium KH2T8]
MTENMEIVFQQIVNLINTKYSDRLPTEDQIYAEAELLRTAFSSLYPLSDDEFSSIKKRLPEQIIHSIGYAVSLHYNDDDHQEGWYDLISTDDYFWSRYKKYLGRKWSEEVITRLHQTTSGVMNDLGDPQSELPFQRRGLLLGDVQSGKTATYTAICNKATDCGYRVIIVLAGTMENLRIQTQERLDAEFVGLDSKYTLDKKADTSMKNIPVGVGLIGSNNQEKRITRFTSVRTDFKKSVVDANGLNLQDLNSTALFVVKKNKSVLTNLHNWLTKDEDKLNLPLLLIDDEADNASINTNAEGKNRTAINEAINLILHDFVQATYLGITATPFANIFIDPEMDEDGAAKDLFPRHFLTLLPTPEKYIGADRIFGNGEEDDYRNRCKGEFNDSLVKIMNKEQEHFFYFGHKKELADSLYDLPESLYEAIRYFVICTAISDLRFDNTEHRTMMVNVSRFTDVQNTIAELVEQYVKKMLSDIENYSQLDCEKALRITTIKKMKDTWDSNNFSDKTHITWETIQKQYLLKAIKRIVVRAVNQKTGAQSLDYFNYRKIGMRVIAVGGNSLSRGLTLEGLCVSYFYRNTMMYDTLLQMGRWFGYRPNYQDLFKIWMGEDAIDWYGYITDAFNDLKNQLREMAKQNSSPREFGLKVRQDPGALIVTARNKMRSGTIVPVPITVSGRMIESPRLWNDGDIAKANNELCTSVLCQINQECEGNKDDFVNAYIWRKVPAKYVAQIIQNYKSHPWSLNFQASALSELILKDSDLAYWDVAIPWGTSTNGIQLLDVSSDFKPEPRPLQADKSFKKMVRVYGHHVRIGQGGCTKIGLERDTIEDIKNKCKADNKKITDGTYLSKEIERKPLLLIHVLENTSDPLEGFPDLVYALGLGFPGGKKEKTAYYMVNTTELKNYIDMDEMEEEEENDVSGV